MNDAFTTYIDSFVSGVLNRPGIAELPAEKKDLVAQQIRDRVNELVLETLFTRLGEEELKDIRGAIGKPEALEQKLELYASSVPGLAEDITNRLERESAFLHASL